MSNGHKVNGLYLEAEKWAAGMDDSRFLDRDTLLAAWVMDQYLVNLGDERDTVVYGQSYRMGIPFGRLVVKATVQGEPFVCFISCRSCLQGWRIFLRQWREDMVVWTPDRFA